MIDEKEYEYIRLAAFVDGEGTISIFKAGKGYAQHLVVTNCDIRLIAWLVDNFGGKFPKPIKHENENHKDVYMWRLHGMNSYKLIKKIRQHLLLKREQANLAIYLYEQVSKWHYGSNPTPKYKQVLAEELYQKAKILNKRGKQLDEEDNNKIEIKIIIDPKNKTWEDYEVHEWQ